MLSGVQPAHRQTPYAVRLDHGPVGAAAIGSGAAVAVVVDVLSFTTTLSIATARGIAVLPLGWRDDRAPAYAVAHDAVLAQGRRPPDGLLSPRVMAAADPEALPRVVLPSPNGSAICFGLRDVGLTVVGASLRNRRAVARWLRHRRDGGGPVAIVAAGERWPDGSLRPAVEDLWGAGAVVAALVEEGAAETTDLSPEAAAALAAYRAVAADLPTAMAACASGRELVAAGFGDDVDLAADLDVDYAVPVLDGEAFGPAGGDGRTSPPR